MKSSLSFLRGPQVYLALIFAALLLFLCLYNLEFYPRLWFDEGWHLQAAKHLAQTREYCFGPGVGPTVFYPVAWAFRLLPSGGYTKQIFYGSGSGESGFGLSVGVDGEWLAIADPYGPTYPPQHVGSVYLYRLISGTWVHQQNITASDAAPGFRFGSDLDIDDGRLIVGLGAGTGSNRAYVFELRGTSWMEMAVLEVPIGADGVCKVALQGDRAVMRTLGSAQGPGAACEHVRQEPVHHGAHTEVVHFYHLSVASLVSSSLRASCLFSYCTLCRRK